MVEVSVMVEIFAGLLVVAMVVVPLALAVWSDRRREAADAVAARVRAAVRQRLGGEAFVTVEVTAPWLAQRGRVVLAAPAGYGWMLERAWSAVVPRVPAGYDLVVSEPAVVSAPSNRVIAPTLRRAA
jgi:hypothetical protein